MLDRIHADVEHDRALGRRAGEHRQIDAVVDDQRHAGRTEQPDKGARLDDKRPGLRFRVAQLDERRPAPDGADHNTPDSTDTGERAIGDQVDGQVELLFHAISRALIVVRRSSMPPSMR